MTIKKVVIKKGVTAIPKGAFMNCSKLKSVSFPDTV
ncbi:MAG: leucine-rich repeat domain-containing protein, partial [Lachnospiraceae bacterium]|nr:leucine-rich repeat domain-containing protein [Lachnospiraceae bacterium]